MTDANKKIIKTTLIGAGSAFGLSLIISAITAKKNVLHKEMLPLVLKYAALASIPGGIIGFAVGKIQQSNIAKTNSVKPAANV